ncbi:MAG TPA: hypothetical protein VGL81_28270 [Polyangiaceae bacterium]|jgi:hypothetical protein|nr:hypothetical protein [Polyangiaceae bacterium]
MGDHDEDRRFTTRVGPIDVDWPRAVGFYGGIVAAVAFDLIAPPLALFVAIVPLLKLLKRKDATVVEKAVAAVLEGASKPVGGDAEAVVRPAWADAEQEEKSAASPAVFGPS